MYKKSLSSKSLHLNTKQVSVIAATEIDMNAFEQWRNTSRAVSFTRSASICLFLALLYALLSRHFIQGPVCLYVPTISLWLLIQSTTKHSARMGCLCANSVLRLQYICQAAASVKSLIRRAYWYFDLLKIRPDYNKEGVGEKESWIYMCLCFHGAVTPWCLLLRRKGPFLSNCNSSEYQQAN